MLEEFGVSRTLYERVYSDRGCKNYLADLNRIEWISLQKYMQISYGKNWLIGQFEPIQEGGKGWGAGRTGAARAATWGVGSVRDGAGGGGGGAGLTG